MAIVLVGIFLGCHEVIRLDEHDINHIYHNKVENWVRGIGETKREKLTFLGL